ncbi:hypothetical protein L915_08845 [Phytophthora nicotianae]|uniref:Uncharacterized protein n=1 Tax=Phytophthora nicotianae TaxID=4792 RepID=W2GUJ3_PHYNI|nr:hypothetical protein L915_08845 [Phytophthora nicotianae]
MISVSLSLSSWLSSPRGGDCSSSKSFPSRATIVQLHGVHSNKLVSALRTLRLSLNPRLSAVLDIWFQLARARATRLENAATGQEATRIYTGPSPKDNQRPCYN